MLDLEGGTELFKLLGDPTRVRLLSLLGQEELTVGELARATRLPQPRVSTHLARLREGGLVRDRRAGPSCFYSASDEWMPEDARAVWAALRARNGDPLLEQDRERVRDLIGARGESWADSVAGQMERHYSPGRTWEAALRGLLGLANLGDVLDIASGDGALAELVVGRARSVTCVDLSRKVAAAGARRLSHLPGVHFRVADMHDLPFAEGSFDQVLLMNALTYSERPSVAIAEARRVLRPGGALAAVTLGRHRHRAVADTYTHVQLGIDPDEIRELLSAAGFEVSLCEVTSREKRPPHFEVVTAHARCAEAPEEIHRV